MQRTLGEVRPQSGPVMPQGPPLRPCSLLWSQCQPPGRGVCRGWVPGGDPKGEQRPPPETPETQGRLSPKSARTFCSRKPASSSQGAFCFPGRAASHPPAHVPLAFSRTLCDPTRGCWAQRALSLPRSPHPHTVPLSVPGPCARGGRLKLHRGEGHRRNALFLSQRKYS